MTSASGDRKPCSSGLRSLVSKLTTFVDDAVLLLLLTMAIPFALLIVGAPLALIIRVVVEIFGRIF